MHRGCSLWLFFKADSEKMERTKPTKGFDKLITNKLIVDKITLIDCPGETDAR
jgi:hypothetical protein